MRVQKYAKIPRRKICGADCMYKIWAVMPNEDVRDSSNRSVFALFEFAWDLPALEIIFAVMLVDFAQYAAGVAHRHTVRGDILRHHAARTDDGVVADGSRSIFARFSPSEGRVAL